MGQKKQATYCRELFMITHTLRPGSLQHIAHFVELSFDTVLSFPTYFYYSQSVANLEKLKKTMFDFEVIFLT